MKTLVTYFSATGTTAKVAHSIAEAVEADIYEIKPKVPYTDKDLNWQDKCSRSSVEMADKSYRPEIEDSDAHIENYDVIFVGFPIWWYVAPTIINTFLEKYDFSGKSVILFATSGGSGFGHTIEELENSISSSAKIQLGQVVNKAQTKEEILQWVKALGCFWN